MTADYFKITVYKTPDRFLPYKYIVTRGSYDLYVCAGWNHTQSGAVRAAKKALQKKTKKLMFKEVESFIVNE